MSEINILRFVNDDIYYKCSCGCSGVATYKKIGKNNNIVFDLSCALCGVVERILLSTDGNKDFSLYLLEKNEVILD